MLNIVDANESALRSYMRQQDNEHKREGMIEARTVALMACGEYAHDTGDAIIEALSECNHAQCEAIGKAAHAGSTELGNKILSVSFAYWHGLAKSKAEEEVDADWDSCKCHGAGCRNCSPEDE